MEIVKGMKMMKVAIETIGNGIFHQLGIWEEMCVPSDIQKQKAINMVNSSNGFTNKKGITFVLSEISGIKSLIAIKEDKLIHVFEKNDIPKFEAELKIKTSFISENIDIV